MHQIARVIAIEGRAKYNEAIRNGDRSRFAGLTFWSPNIRSFAIHAGVAEWRRLARIPS